MTMHILNLIPLSLFAAFIAWLAFVIGRCKGRDSLGHQLERLWRYQHAVDDLDRWCGHMSPHARLIARHLSTIGEGKEGLNAGTPVDVEPCTIDGLRQQLKKLDVIESTLGEHALAGERMRAAMRAYDAGRLIQQDSKTTVTAIVGNPETYRDAPSIHPISCA
jgi:hypothetical protein